MKNNIICEEGCSLPSSSNELEIVIRNLKREIIDLSTNTEATLLIHDGKIAEMCRYIKNNLSNSIRELIDSMELSGELDRIILSSINNEYSNLNNEVKEIKKLVLNNMKFYLPSAKNYHYGQFSCLGITNNTCCLFDLGHELDSDYNLNYFKSILNGRKIKYVFISHYHGDHYGGITKFKEIYDKDIKFYICKSSESYYTGTDSIDVNKAYSTIKNILNSNGYRYVEVDDILTINLESNIKLNLYNSNSDSYSYYKSKGTDDYNNYSMVIGVDIDNKHVLMGFDGANITQEYLRNKNLVKKADVLFNFHHGNYSICDREYMIKLNPDIVIDTLASDNIDNFDGTESFNNSPFNDCKLLSNTRDEIVLNVNPFSVEVEKGNNKHDSIRNHKNIEVYLNPDFTGLECIGTSDKPFKTFNQIFEFIPKSCQTLTINVSGTKMKTNQRFYNTFNKLIIKGNPNSKCEFYDFQLDNCHKVEISDIKFSTNTVHIFNSDVRFTDCEFTQPKTQNVNITNSNVTFNKCDLINSTREAITSGDKSLIRLSGCVINAPVYGIAGTSTILMVYNTSVLGTKNYYRLTEGSEIIANKVGSTSERPDFGESYYCNGYTYFDSEINRLVYYDYDSPTTKWKTSDGIDV